MKLLPLSSYKSKLQDPKTGTDYIKSQTFLRQMYKYVMQIKAEYINPRCEKEQNMLKVLKITGGQSTCLTSDYQLKDKEKRAKKKNCFILQKIIKKKKKTKKTSGTFLLICQSISVQPLINVYIRNICSSTSVPRTS